MGLIGYILDVLRRDSGADVGPVTIHLLQEFTHNTLTSSYQVYRNMRNSEHSNVSYKNTNKKIHKLHNLGLIKTMKIPNPKHGAIYYRLTSLGIFYIFLKDLTTNLSMSDILTNYGDDELFKNLLYVYFERDLIHQIRPFPLGKEIVSYLSAFCKRIDERIKYVKGIEKQFGRLSKPILSWDEISVEGPNPRFLSYLKSRFNLDFDNDVVLKRINDDTTVEIKDRKHHISIELNRSRTNANLFANNDKLFEFDIRPSDLNPDELVLRDPQGFLAEPTIIEIKDLLLLDLEEELGKMIFSWAIRYKHYMSIFRHRREDIKRDLSLLCQDEKFLETLQKVTSKYNEYSAEIRRSAAQIAHR